MTGKDYDWNEGNEQETTGPMYVNAEFEIFAEYEKDVGRDMEGVSKMSEKGRNTFILSDEMRKYFYKIGVKSSNESGHSRSGVFPTNIHPFYLCMIMGISKNMSGDPQPMKQTMVAEWVSEAQHGNITFLV